MRITDGQGRPLNAVYLALSDDEATSLMGALQALLRAQEGWHEHVNDVEHRHEITVYRQDDESASF